jgi:hypothetical protein
VLISGAVVDVVVCDVEHESQFLAPSRKNPGIADSRQTEDLDYRALVLRLEGKDIKRVTGQRGAKQ